jgi:2-polyprenyl-3-methyl-5-hydroxy-6-metoxy-1,4-benzoquinol methylase
MKQKGFACTGIEVDEVARNFAIKNFGLDINSPDILINEFQSEKFDVITLWHVLEHLHDTPTYLTWIFNALKPEGKLLIALPNCDSYDAASYRQYWAAYDVPRHLWHFTPSSLENYLNQHEFSLQGIKRMPFDAYYNSMMSAKYAGKKFSLANGLLIGMLSNFMSLFNKKKASSVLYILEKQK